MKTMNLMRKAAVAGLLLGLAQAVGAGVQDLGEGSMQVVSGEGKERILTLKHTGVKAEISAFTPVCFKVSIRSFPSPETTCMEPSPRSCTPAPTAWASPSSSPATAAFRIRFMVFI